MRKLDKSKATINLYKSLIIILVVYILKIVRLYLYIVEFYCNYIYVCYKYNKYSNVFYNKKNITHFCKKYDINIYTFR